ncbi:uncharacterized protein BJ212DRAFT_1481189 [Suillus subaureus]|uniref:Uncharacterized protein n=1 Tax=Suillus subaureus TaxID=48587 RepID=A0A9P7JDL2_9AGAM|nr:uncharacterized protein BJ212DRAFT_1481189 [Suillus subaureus]KAG1816120.1 hypothetical protein BJ212DRAFT_1481189 [Suillus subaureus]
MSESEAQCALNPDGSLKDAKDITFYNDPDDAVPISAPSSAQPPSSTTPTVTFSVLDTPFAPLNLLCTFMMPTMLVLQQAASLSAPLSDNEGSHVAGANTDIDTDPDPGAGQSDEAEDEDVPAPEDEPEDEPEDLQDTTIRATLSKSEHTTDI